MKKLFACVLLGFSILCFAQVPDFVSLSEKASPSVVNISTSRVVKGGTPGPRFAGPGAEHFNDMLEQFFGQPLPQMPDYNAQSLGSGFFISEDGYLITNYHVVREADTIVVGLNGGDEYEAKVVGVDPTSDLALLKIDIKTKTPYLEFGKSDDLKVGEWVMAIGSPFGFDYTVTQGIVSAIGRGLQQDRYVPFIQTDVAINPGSSGGPLLNGAGKVIGINSQIVSRTGGYLGLSFAIPSDVAKDVVKQLKSTGKVKRGYLGVAFQEIDKNLAQSFGMAQPKGALVAQVVPDSPASKAGLKDGDIITSFNKEPVDNASDLPHLVGFSNPGTEVQLGLIRDGKTMNVSAEIGELKTPEDHHQNGHEESKRESNLLGLSLRELTPEEKRMTDLSTGMLISYVAPNSPASTAGLRAGDLVFTINKTPVNTPDDFKAVLSKVKPGSVVPVLMVRKGMGQRYVALKVQK